jgi:hypothetical protein
MPKVGRLLPVQRRSAACHSFTSRPIMAMAEAVPSPIARTNRRRQSTSTAPKRRRAMPPSSTIIRPILFCAYLGFSRFTRRISSRPCWGLCQVRRELRGIDDQQGGPTEARDIADAIIAVAACCRLPGFADWRSTISRASGHELVRLCPGGLRADARARAASRSDCELRLSAAGGAAADFAPQLPPHPPHLWDRPARLADSTDARHRELGDRTV